MLKRIWQAQQRQSFSIGLTSVMAASLLMIMLALLLFVLRNSSGYFWPDSIVALEYRDHNGLIRQHFARQTGTGSDPHWVSQTAAQQHQDLLFSKEHGFSQRIPSDVAEFTLNDGRSVYARLGKLYDQQLDYAAAEYDQLRQQSDELQQQVHRLTQQQLSPLHMQLAEMNKRAVEPTAPARVKLEQAFQQEQDKLQRMLARLNQYQAELIYADGQSIRLPLSQIEQLIYPNQMGLFNKIGHAIYSFGIFVSDVPKQANTAGGVFPALFGTVLMVMLMSVIVTPLGILAAIYLHEYAPQNLLTSLVRTCVNNLAGIPSIVFGVFGLGFLVYSLGGSIDQLFFSEDLPNPTLGSPGIFWAALTMALLTLPVVIVSTEEGLRRVPNSLRQGSYALGATQAETIRYTVLPIASPGIMTGIILAIARAAGEVAPLILVGAVKFAPALPVDGEFPYLHLDRQFMHLGVMIYDGAFHGQHGSQGTEFMFAACFLLLLIVFALNLIATLIRSTLRRRYAH